MGKCIRVTGSEHVFDVLRQDLNWSTIITSSPSNSSFFFLNFGHVCYDTVHMVGNLRLIIEASGSSETTVNTLHCTQYRNTQDRRLHFHLCQCSQFCAVPLILDPLAHHLVSHSLKMYCQRTSCWVSVYLFVIDIGVWYTWMEITLICVYKTWNVLLNKTASVIFKQGVF